MSDLTAPDLVALRGALWINDYWKPAPINWGASRYNVANRRNFFADDEIKAIDDRIMNDRAEELLALRTEKYNERLAYGDSDAVAVTTADAAKKFARFGLITADCLEIMKESPDLAAAYVVGGDNKATELFKNWTEAIQRLRNFARSRSGGFASVAVERE